MNRPAHIDAAYRRLDRGWTGIQHGAHGLDVVTLLGHIDTLEGEARLAAAVRHTVERAIDGTESLSAAVAAIAAILQPRQEAT